MAHRFVIIFVLIFCNLLEVVSAQNLPPNDKVQRLMKYWLYRKRLQEDFLVGITGEHGHGIPSQGRNYSNHALDFGDQTIYFSYYISVLATEYKLLSNWNQPTDKIVAELYFALKSFNDLDGFSESFYDSQWGYTLNGFFARDDVGMDYYNGTTPNANYFNAINNLNQGHFGTSPVTTFGFQSGSQGSGWVDYTIYANHSGTFEESKDQVVALLCGLRVVQECISGISYQNNDIQQMAKSIGQRVVDWIHTPNVTPNALHWKIKNPATGNNVSSGYDAAGWAYGMSKTLKKLTGNNNPTTLSAMFDVSWIALKRDFKWGARNYYIAFGAIPDEGWKMISLLCSSGCCETDWLKIDSYSRSYFKPSMRFWHFPLLWKFLEGGHMVITQSDYEDLLNDAPCFGPYNYGNGQYLHGNFSSPSKLYTPDLEGGNLNLGSEGDFNGLDYMLLYNLFLLTYYSSGDADYINLYNTEIYESLPFANSNAIGKGISGDAAYITSHKTIEAFSTIHSTGVVTFRAGESITLQNGFLVEPGADFAAVIDDFICNQDGDQYLKLNNSNQITEEIYPNPTQLSNNKISVYPQPSINNCYIEFNVEVTEAFSLELYNEIGSKVESIFNNKRFDKGKYTVELNCTRIPSGMYLVKLNSELSSYSKKIVINK